MPRSYRFYGEINQGFYGTVYGFVDDVSNLIFAVKIQPIGPKAYDEMHALRSFGHPNVVEMVDHFESGGISGIVMPMMHMDLSHFLQFGPFPGDTMLDMKMQIMRGVHHIHSRGALHLDIKPENVGIKFNGKDPVRCKLLDFGSSKFMANLCVGDAVQTTRRYRPPEMAKGIVGPGSDVYSTGVLFSVMLGCVSDAADGRWQPLISDMTRSDPRLRPQSKEVLSRLGDRSCMVVKAVRGPFWTSEVANIADGRQELLVHDTSDPLQRMVTLVCSDDLEDIENGFWLLQEEARRSGMVNSVLHYFHARLHLSKMACYFYVKALEHLSRAPDFFITHDQKLHLWKASELRICERAVIRILARAIQLDLLDWCLNPKLAWGSKQEPFANFVEHFCAVDSLCHTEASTLLAAV